jgi:hypothetical protein
MAFKLPYIFDYIKKLWRQRAEIIQIHENANFRKIGEANPGKENIRSLESAADKNTTAVVARATNDRA